MLKCNEDFFFDLVSATLVIIIFYFKHFYSNFPLFKLT
jgi:hypothetical protein